ncbi:hypothetical protein, partial [Spirosoma sp.]|uniref:hypothetical protein n=1 Tax=Spirosoma sp. TaxID=1899569 RepID=UPI003B3BC789
MIHTHSSSQYEYFLSYFEATPVKILRDRKTGELLFDLASVAKCLGFASTEAMMSNDHVLDYINLQIKQTG